MIKKILITIVCLFTSLIALADVLQVKENAPKTYVVQKGDTLWDISAMYLNEPWLWPQLWRINPEVNNPHLIYPGDTLRLVFNVQGEPMLVKGKPSLKWSPQIRKTLKDQNPISYLPFDVVAPYLDYARVLTGKEFAQAPYVLGGDEKYKSNMEGALLYVKGELNSQQHYAIYEKGEPVIDPQTQESLGYHAKLIGTAQGVRKGNLTDKKPSSLYLDSSNQEIRAGSIVLPVNEGQLYPAVYAMQAIKGKDIEARMISSRNLVREFGKFEVVLLNKGERDEIRMGEVYGIYRQSPDVIETDDGPIYEEDASSWYRLTRPNASDRRISMPKEQIGHLMVFKVLEKTSYAIVLATHKSVHIDDTVGAP
ncbi:LysM domain-containing protein [Thalassotalea ponticola]|uniref:LysM peptidoglycan-binding domain-containing protein n=1 Tax=Thalassotalea ponticola TaxID=1523392 RepID=UPI0025B355D9|nr:LysM domain-containing protein [Thalassotalea ponticola]MDN3653048.1 LysM domain-containing protein [Thalassotalea ponticola]